MCEKYTIIKILAARIVVVVDFDDLLSNDNGLVLVVVAAPAASADGQARHEARSQACATAATACLAASHAAPILLLLWRVVNLLVLRYLRGLGLLVGVRLLGMLWRLVPILRHSHGAGWLRGQCRHSLVGTLVGSTIMLGRWVSRKSRLARWRGRIAHCLVLPRVRHCSGLWRRRWRVRIG